MPKFEVTVLTKYECESASETEATIACCALAGATVDVTRETLDGVMEHVNVLSSRVFPQSSDVTRCVPLVNGVAVADDLADVDREDEDCCEICEFPASAGHDPLCPEHPEYSTSKKAEALSTPKRERGSDEREDVESLLTENMQKVVDGDLFDYTDHIEELEDKEVKGEIEADEKTELKEHREKHDRVIPIHTEETGVSVENLLVSEALLSIDRVPVSSMGRILRRVICWLGHPEPAHAAGIVQANMTACILAMVDYEPDLVFNLDPERRLYVDFEKREVKQMERPHLLAETQEWF